MLPLSRLWHYYFPNIWIYSIKFYEHFKTYINTNNNYLIIIVIITIIIIKLTLGESPGDIEVNAFVRHQARIRNEWYSRSEVISKIKKRSELLEGKNDTVFGEWWQKRSDFQAHIERISDFVALGHGKWWHFEENNIVMHDAHGMV